MPDTTITPISEPYEKGLVEGVIITENDSVVKYRVVYTEERKDEWSGSTINQKNLHTYI